LTQLLNLLGNVALPTRLDHCTGCTEQTAAHRALDTGVDDAVDVVLAKQAFTGSGGDLGHDAQDFLSTLGHTFQAGGLGYLNTEPLFDRRRHHGRPLHQFVERLVLGLTRKLRSNPSREDRVKRRLADTKQKRGANVEVARLLVDVLKDVRCVRTK
jgi:hypothetical protein